MTTRAGLLGYFVLEYDQTNKYVTVNDALLKIAGAAVAVLAISTTGDVTLTDAQATSYAAYKVSGATAAFNFIIPHQPYSGSGGATIQRVITVQNATDYAMTVKTDTTGTTTVVGPQETVNVLVVNADVTRTRANGRDILAQWTGTISGTDKQLLRFKATTAMLIPKDFAGSVGSVGTNPAASATFNVKKNGSAAGTIVVSTGGVFTFSASGSSISLAIGDVLTITSPNPNDASIADIGINIRALEV